MDRRKDTGRLENGFDAITQKKRNNKDCNNDREKGNKLPTEN